MRKLFQSAVLVPVLLVLLGRSGAGICSETQSESTQKKPDATAENSDKNKLADGLYLVVRSASKASELEPLAPTEKIIQNDFHFLEPAEREPLVYLVLQTKPFIPFALSADPKEDTEESTGKPRLQLVLTEEQKQPLEEFTKEHVGGKVAIVIGGEVVTTHKLRTAITEGRFQITRCTEHGCKTLFTRLLKDRSH